MKLLTIKEFCSFARISRSLYYALKRSSKGPAETRIGTRVLIREETAREWLKSQEKATQTAKDNQWRLQMPSSWA